jgi:hypothetical protein
MMHHFHGSCHCGNLEVDYTTTITPEKAMVRACQCSFCRKHDARAISDPNGMIELTVHNPSLLERYRFELGVTDYLICRKCGVYVSAYSQRGTEAYANVMVNVLDAREQFPDPSPVHLDGEDELEKWQRRTKNWTPATLRIADQ